MGVCRSTRGCEFCPFGAGAPRPPCEPTPPSPASQPPFTLFRPVFSSGKIGVAESMALVGFGFSFSWPRGRLDRRCFSRGLKELMGLTRWGLQQTGRKEQRWAWQGGSKDQAPNTPPALYFCNIQSEKSVRCSKAHTLVCLVWLIRTKATPWTTSSVWGLSGEVFSLSARESPGEVGSCPVVH